MINYHGKAEGPLLPSAYGKRVLSLFFGCGVFMLSALFLFFKMSANYFGGV